MKMILQKKERKIVTTFDVHTVYAIVAGVFSKFGALQTIDVGILLNQISAKLIFLFYSL